MKKLSAIITTALMLTPASVLAEYRSSSDTGLEIFDYIENRHREERENRLTEEQQQLLQDIDKAKAQLPNPSKTYEKDPAPAVFEGDDLIYHADTGEFIATGKVDILQIDGHRFQTKAATGNVKEQVVRIKDRAHVLQLKEGAPRITLDGYRTVYNYGTKTGTMGRAKGKAGHYYISGRRFEFYPDHIVVYNGTQTKCGAIRPDYHLSAEKMEIWPEQVIKMYEVKFWIKDTIVGAKAYEEREINDTGQNQFPRVGYNKDNGLYVEQRFEQKINDNVKTVINAHINTKHGIRSSGELRYDNRDSHARLVYGYYYDDNNNWIQKLPSLILNYNRHMSTMPLFYNLEYEIGRWRSDTVSSTHQKYEFGLGRDTIFFNGWALMLYTSFTVTKESADNSTVKGMNYYATLAKEFNKRFAAYTAFQYTKNTSDRSLFKYENEDYEKQFSLGATYRLDDKNRVAMGMKFDADRGSLEDVDYYWYHDLHCSQLIMRYREKRSKFEAQWQFTPW